ncbi:hypothetical protein F4803DRAFT_524253, partial [Xylaria telfairii]
MPGNQCKYIQPKAVDAFREHLGAILGSWEIKPTYKDNCLLLTSDWATLDPATVMSLFNYWSCPLADAPVQTYRFADHQTNISRAIAWLSNSPRSGIELDNFTGAGPFKNMQGSHLCHHRNCVVPSHIVYEAADLNEDRKQCHLRAIFLRSDDMEIPERCSVHEPGCLLRLACRTTYESHLIQFSVLRRARGLPEPTASPCRPRGHRYGTFIHEATPIQAGCEESRVTARFDADDLQKDIPPRQLGRPDLICPFCRRTKAFRGPTAFWSHLVKEHDGIDEGTRLAEVRRTALLWRRYWAEDSEGGRRDGPTMTRLREAVADDLTWEHILDWGL